MKYTQIPTNTFETLQMNAGILVKEFDPATGDIDGLLGATTGGIQFTDSMEFVDLGGDVDNCPKNMLELKMLQSHDVKISGTFVTIDATSAHSLAAAADVDAEDETHLIPRNDLDVKKDFQDIWFIGDYSNVNDGSNAGFLAIHLMNALNTGGFQVKTTDRGKGNFAFEYTGHYSMDAQDTVPYEIYLKAGGEEPGPTPPTPTTPSVTLNKESTTLSLSGTDEETLTAVTVPAGETVTWTTSDDTVAEVAAGVVTAKAQGTATITAKITVDGHDYTDTCSVTVTA